MSPASRPSAAPAATPWSFRGRILAAGIAVLAIPFTLILCTGILFTEGVSSASGHSSAGARPYAVTRSTASSAFPHLESVAAATWCGTPSEVDATPNVVAGNPVHWIYAFPSDGEDRLSSIAHQMQTDWETIDGWWRGQDPARTLRSDLAPFTCGNQLDISSVRLPRTGSQLSAPEEPFELIFDSLFARGFSSSRSKYVVYYDGPVGNDNICGVAATNPNGLGMAVTMVQSCAGITSGEVTAHESIHALGAVSRGAPHECPAPNDGHTCDNNRDIMYPTTDGTPLSGLQLDPGRDDYYGHSGSWPDVQDSPWLVQLDRQTPLDLTITGPGRVVADVPGLDCTRSCTTTWNSGTRLVLTPSANPGAKVVRWSAPCTGASQCAVVTGQNPSATVLFAPATFRVSVRVTGRGRVLSSGSAIACPGQCSASVVSFRPLRLGAGAAPGWRFKSWAGACKGKRTTCVLPMSGNATARAIFVRR